MINKHGLFTQPLIATSPRRHIPITTVQCIDYISNNLSDITLCQPLELFYQRHFCSANKCLHSNKTAFMFVLVITSFIYSMIMNCAPLIVVLYWVCCLCPPSVYTMIWLGTEVIIGLGYCSPICFPISGSNILKRDFVICMLSVYCPIGYRRVLF